MGPKLELSSVDIAAVVSELRARLGATVDKAYLYDGGLLRLRMRDREHGRLELLVEVGERKRAHLADPDRVPPAPERPPNFARMLRNRIAGATFVGVDQYEFDRIVRLSFDRGGEATEVVVELFGEGNVAVLDAAGDVVDCLETVRLKSRTVAPGSHYEYPASRVNPFGLGFGDFVDLMDASDTDLVRTVATQLDFGGLYAEELCARADVPKTRPIGEATADDYEALYAAIEALEADLVAGRFDPRIYLDEGGDPVDVAPFPLVEYEGFASEADGSFNEILDRYFDSVSDSREAEADAVIDERIDELERILESQREAIDRFEDDAAAERERAERVYAHYGLVDEVLTTVREAREEGIGWDEIGRRLADGADRGIAAAEAVEAVDGAAGEVSLDLDGLTVALDPAEGVEHNADRLYESAKEIEDKRAGAIDALEETRAELEALERERAAGSEPTQTAEAGAEPVDWLNRASVPVNRPDHWYDRFRWFETSDGFLVIGGRDADQNEELVGKYLEGGDRFIHAEAHGGPATVLKATGPNERARSVEFPESTLEEAARFAVSYSSVWGDGRFAGDAYAVEPEQVSKTAESGEYLGKGAFVVRGERRYFRDVPVGVAIGVQCEPETRVIGGPPSAVRAAAVTAVDVEPGGVARTDVAKRLYRDLKGRFADPTFVRQIASVDEIVRFLPSGRSRIVEE